jgi:hypothetical protein
MARSSDVFNSPLAHRASQQRVLFKQALTPASAASASVRAVGDCSSLTSTPRGYTFPVFSAFWLRCVLLARDTLILF